MKIRLPLVASLPIFLFLMYELLLASSFQPPTKRTGAPGESTCTACHSGVVNSGGGTLVFDFNGADTTYIKDSTYTLSLTISDPGALRFGFELTVLDASQTSSIGTLAITNALNTSLQTALVSGNSRQYIGQKSANSNNSWTFEWTAPATAMGDLTFFVTGNAANNNGGTTGDQIYAGAFVITPVEPLLLSDSLPCIPEDSLITTDVSLQLYDPNMLMDTISMTIVNGANHGVISFDGVSSILQYTPHPDYYGLDSFHYCIYDQQGLIGPNLCHTSEICISPVNDPPIVTADFETVNGASTVDLNVMANDYDIDGPFAALTASIVTQPSNGAATIDPLTGIISYTADPLFTGPDTIYYAVCDTSACDSGYVVLNVFRIFPPTPPVAVVDSFCITEDSIGSFFDVLLNDFDTTGDSIVTTEVVIPPTQGTASNGTIADGDSIGYTPDPNFVGMDSLSYSICDTTTPVSLCDSSWIYIKVLPINDAPTAIVDFDTINEDAGFIFVDVLANDFDIDGDSIYTLIMLPTPPLHGSGIVFNNDSIRYIPDLNYYGPDSFEYAICDTSSPAACDTQWVYVTVFPVLDWPVATNDFVACIPLNSTTVIDPTVNDTDPDGGILVATIFSGPSNGTAVKDPVSSEFTYSGTIAGQDTITYIVCDNGFPSLCDTAMIFLCVDPAANAAPTATDDVVACIPINSTTVFEPLLNDTDPDGALLTSSLQILSGPNNGTAVLNPVNGEITYTGTLAGQDTIVYAVCDDGVPTLCDSAMIFLCVDPAINVAPTATNDIVACIPLSSTTIIDPLVNDIDTDGALLPATVLILSGPNNGTAVLNPVNGEITYTGTLAGQDTISYAVCDDGVPTLCDSAMIFLCVDPAINVAPTATNDIVACIPLSSTTIIDPLLNDFDTDGALLPATVLILSGPNNGTAFMILFTGEITYSATSAGQDTITYLICDDGIPTLCDSAMIFLCVDPASNVAPTATNDIVACIPFSSTTIIDPLVNDIDTDGALLPATVLILSGPNNGTAVLNPVNGEITYTGTLAGQDTISYAVCDDGVPTLCDSAMIFLCVDPASNVAPIATNDIVACIPLSSTIIIDPLLNDIDTDGALLPATVLILSGPNNGTAVLNPVNGEITYTGTLAGQDTIGYAVCDDGVPTLCDTAMILLCVDPAINVAPTVTNDIVACIPLNSTTIIDPLLNDIDTDGALLPATVLILSGPNNGTAVLNPVNGEITYTGTLAGQDTIGYAVCDDGVPTLCDTAMIFLCVDPAINVAPTATNDIVACIPFSSTTIIDPLVNDIDTDGALLPATVLILSGPNNGTAVLNPVNGEITYTGTLAGQDTIGYAVCDDGVPTLCDSAMIFLCVDPASNVAPTAVDDIVACIPLNSSTVIDPLVNDIDTDGALLVSSLSILSGPNNGAAVVDPVSGEITYSGTIAGQDTITYSICDNGGLCDTAMIFLCVDPASNIAPTAVNDIYACIPLNSTTVFEPLLNDMDTDGALLVSSLSILSGPNNGAAVVDPVSGEITYSGTIAGQDTITYSICDNGGLCDTAMIFLCVDPASNIAPTAVNDIYACIPLNSTTVFEPLLNDMDPDGALLLSSLSILSGPNNGTAVVDPVSAEITYSGMSAGQDTITYMVCDDGTPVLCDTAMIYLCVDPTTNFAPTAVNDYVACIPLNTTTIIAPLLNDMDVDGALLASTMQLISGPYNGTVAINPVNGELTYSAAFPGQDSIGYLICDDGTPALCDTAMVFICVDANNTAPTAIDDTIPCFYNTEANVLISPLMNDIDSDGFIDPTSLVILGSPSLGIITVDVTSGTFLFTPDPLQSGTETIEYTICDDGSPVLCDTAIIYLCIQEWNTPPLAMNDTVSCIQNTLVEVIPILANDTDSTGLLVSSSIELVISPSNGTVSIDHMLGTLIYTASGVGQDSMSYAICDNGLQVLCDSAWVYMCVTPYVGLNEFQVENLHLFPNPAKNTLQLISAHPLIQVQVTDMSGRVIMDLQKPGQQIDIGGLSSGLYLIRGLNSIGQAVQTRFVKE